MDTCTCGSGVRREAGTYVEDDVVLCGNCRRPTAPPPTLSRMSIVSFASAVVAYLLWSVPLFVDVWRHDVGSWSAGDWGALVVTLLFLLAFVGGIIAIVGTRRRRRTGRGFAIAAVVLSVVPAVAGFVFLLALGIAMSTSSR